MYKQISTSSVQYARAQEGTWTASDGNLLAKVFREYLRDTFRDEMGGSDDADQLSSLAETIQRIGYFCKVNVDYYEELINEKIAQSEEDDEGDGDSPHQGHEAVISGTEEEQEDEIDRLFDGLLLN